MKNLLKSIFAFVLLINVSSCIDFSDNIKKEKPVAADFNTVTINKEYEVQIPKYMKATNDLNDQASLQYQNIFKETYFVVIDEPKDEFKKAFLELGEYNDSLPLIANYKDVQLNFFKESLTDYEFISETTKKINGKNTEEISFNGKIEGVIYNIGYILTFVEGKEKVYMLMAWTLADKNDKYQETFEYISNSFRELD